MQDKKNLILFSQFFLVGLFFCFNANAIVLGPGDVVANSSLQEPSHPYYDDFSDALAAVSNGGTVYVYPGIYREQNSISKNGHWNIQGIGDDKEIIITSAYEVDKGLFSQYSGDIYRVGLDQIGVASATYFGVLDVVSKSLLSLQSLSNLNCSYGYAIDDGYLYVYLDNFQSREIEIVDWDLIPYGFIDNRDPDGDFYIRNITFRAASGGPYGRVFYFDVYGSDYVNNLSFEDVNYEMSTGPLVYCNHIDNLIFRRVQISDNHNMNYRMPASSLFSGNSENCPRTYLIEDSYLGPHSRIGSFRLGNHSSVATIRNVTLFSAGVDHTGFEFHSSETSSGKVFVYNSIFASFEHTIEMHNPSTSPYACGLAEHYEDCAHDFAFSPVGHVINATFENNIFAYGTNLINFQWVGDGSTISATNNIFLNGVISLKGGYEIGEWDYNLYYLRDDEYVDYFFSDDSMPRNLTEIQNFFATEFGCLDCDSHSLNAAPELVDWEVDDLMNYGFKPVSETSNVCGAGKNGEDIGAISCSGSATNTTPPTRFNPAPSGVLSSGTTQTNISLTTDKRAVCRYSITPDMNYSDMGYNFINSNSTNHSTLVSGLENGKTYTFYVRCNSSDGIVNDDDFNITFSVDGHKADLNDDGIISMKELIAFIARWKASDGVSRQEVIDARGIWFTGGNYPL